MKYTLFLYALLFHNFLLCMQRENQSELIIPCLKLNSPQHTDAELAELLRRLPANTKIAGIDFSNSSISDKGIIDLVNNIRLDALKILRLNDMRNITARGLSFILLGLQMNQCLEIVELHGLPLSNMCQHVIEALYTNNQRL